MINIKCQDKNGAGKVNRTPIMRLEISGNTTIRYPLEKYSILYYITNVKSFFCLKTKLFPKLLKFYLCTFLPLLEFIKVTF